jgi:hypothetical protein
MSLIQDASGALTPHTKYLAGIIDVHGARIVERLDEIAQASDVGRPDTGDDFKFLIVNSKLPALNQTFDNIVGGHDAGGPGLGEIWMVQSICVNGQPNKSPGFAIRTNTGRLIFAVTPEGMGNETTSGSVILLQGEVLIFEPLLEGVFDFTITVVQRKFPRQEADAGFGVSEEHYEQGSRAFEHESERDFPGHSFVPVA